MPWKELKGFGWKSTSYTNYTLYHVKVEKNRELLLSFFAIFVCVNLLGNDKFCWMRRRRSKACRLGLTSYHRWPTLLGWGLWRCRCGKSPDNRATLGISDAATSLGTFVQICNQAQSIGVRWNPFGIGFVGCRERPTAHSKKLKWFRKIRGISMHSSIQCFHP